MNSILALCELHGCKSKGAEKLAAGTYMVYDGETPTMTRPSQLCSACVEFAKKCGMTPVLV